MSPSTKFGLLALISTASAAVPHYGAHSRLHSSFKPSGVVGTGANSEHKPYPTGGWSGGRNSTRLVGTGGSGEPTTTVAVTDRSTATIFSTIYGGKPSKDNVGASGLPGGTGALGACGPATVTITATSAVTITVPAGGAPGSPSSAALPNQTSQKGGYGSPSSVVDDDEEETPVPSASGQMSIQPVYSSGAAVPSNKPAEPKPSGATKPIGVPSAAVPVPSKGAAPSQAPSSKAAPSAAPSSKLPSGVPSPSKAPSSATPAPSKASSSPASQPSSPSGGGGSGGYSGSKRGFAYNDASACEKLKGAQAGFAWNWAETKTGQLPEGVKFIPTVAKPKSTTPEKAQQSVEKALKDGAAKVVFGFNEPDQPEQAGLDVGPACDAWKQFMNPIAEKNPDVRIVGPSVTNGVGTEAKPMGLPYLRKFISGCKDAKFTDLNVHFYQDYKEGITVQNFKNHCDEAIKLLPSGGKLWVTEFGFLAGQATDEQAAKFLKEAMAYLDGNSAVAGYSYFMAGNPVAGESTLLKGNALTPAGKVYTNSA